MPNTISQFHFIDPNIAAIAKKDIEIGSGLPPVEMPKSSAYAIRPICQASIRRALNSLVSDE